MTNNYCRRMFFLWTVIVTILIPMFAVKAHCGDLYSYRATLENEEIAANANINASKIDDVDAIYNNFFKLLFDEYKYGNVKQLEFYGHLSNDPVVAIVDSYLICKITSKCARLTGNAFMLKNIRALWDTEEILGKYPHKLPNGLKKLEDASIAFDIIDIMIKRSCEGDRNAFKILLNILMKSEGVYGEYVEDMEDVNAKVKAECKRNIHKVKNADKDLLNKFCQDKDTKESREDWYHLICE